MINRVAVTKARINLGSVAKRAHLGGEYFILEKSGIPITGLMDADELESDSRKDAEADRPRDAAELLAQLRGERKASKTMRLVSTPNHVGRFGSVRVFV